MNNCEKSLAKFIWATCLGSALVLARARRYYFAPAPHAARVEVLGPIPREISPQTWNLSESHILYGSKCASDGSDVLAPVHDTAASSR